jgi:predicted metal-binding membrane protein
VKSLTLKGVLAAGRLIRPARSSGFCPACKGWVAGSGDPAHITRREVDPAALTVLVVLVVAALAWILTIGQSVSTSATDMGMGLGSLQSFATTWLVMMAAMMLPTALPLVYEFAHNAEGRRGWQVATAALGVAYLSVWLVFGLACYAVYRAEHALARSTPDWRPGPGAGGALRHHSAQARQRSTLPRVVRAP